MACRAIFSLILTALLAVPSAGRAAVQGGTAAAGDEAAAEAFFLDEPERKDPFVAGILSWSWNGLGQFYTQNYTRGSLFLMTDVVQTGLLVYGIFYYSDKYRSSEDDIVKWENISRRDRGVMIGYVFSLLLVKVLGVVDAVNSAETYNREIYFPYWKNRTRLRFSVETTDDRIDISLGRNLSF